MSHVGSQLQTVPRAQCWCGANVFTPFNNDYKVCAACSTLLSKELPDRSLLLGNDGSLYSKDYWLEYQTNILHQATVFERARTDLSERCLYWLRTVLKFKCPPGRVLEIGCAHGGFLGMLKEIGFEVKGVELSQFVIDLAQKTFGIEVIRGPLEPSQIEAGSLDLVVLLDVLEHLPDPSTVIDDLAKLLKPNGVLLIQTPQWRPGKTYSEMRLTEDPLLHQLMPLEHLVLFNENSIVSFFNGHGFRHIVFEPAIFSIYDMFLVASRQDIAVADNTTVVAVLDRPGS
ncbi:MAG: class I SAM-dependent methyltransferase, partial [Rhodospirillaceae bacterium]